MLVFLKILFSIVLSAGALYTGMNLLDRITVGIDEWKEIKKGNMAIGILYAAVMISIIMLLSPRIGEFIFYLQGGLDLGTTIKLLALTFFNYIVALFASVFIIYLVIHVIDRITPDLDELAELKKGNLAVALILSVALLLVVLAVQPSIENLFDIIKSLESVLL